MSMRSILHFNHDCAGNDDVEFDAAMHAYIRSGDSTKLPDGVDVAWHGHHSDVQQQLDSFSAETAAERDRLRESNDELVGVLERLTAAVGGARAGDEPDVYADYDALCALLSAANSALAKARDDDPGALTGCADGLREALEKIANGDGMYGGGGYKEIARAALAKVGAN